MLTGWDLKAPCNDIKVRDIGVWIKEWDYDPTKPLENCTTCSLGPARAFRGSDIK